MRSQLFLLCVWLVISSDGIVTNTYAKAWNTLLSKATPYYALWGAGNCASAPYKDTDGSTTTTVSNWVNTNLSSGSWNVTGTDQPCTF